MGNSASSNGNVATVIQNGTLIDGSGGPATKNQAIVIEGGRIRSVGQLPPDVNLQDSGKVRAIDASGQWIMPGLIEGHCHLSVGFPAMPGVATGRGTTSAEFSTLRAARNAQKVLRSGVTSVCVPGGPWFIDVAVRDAINARLIEGPRIFCAGRFMVSYGGTADHQPSWVGVPEHTNGVLTNNAEEMVTEVRRQCKHGVNLIKIGDTVLGDIQAVSAEEIRAATDEAHRRNARVTIHSRGAGSTRAAAQAGVDWIMHADLATEADLDAVGEAGVPIMPTLTFMLRALEAGRYDGNPGGVDLIERNVEGCLRVVERAKSLGIKLLCGTDSGNSNIMPYGEFHANEVEVLVKHAGYTPMEAIVANTRDNAFAVGLEGQAGVIEAGKLADIIILNGDPVADVRVLQGGQNLAMVIKDGKMIGLNGREAEQDRLVFEPSSA
jgi:imidazolonepropionase-like amidohydrolase